MPGLPVHTSVPTYACSQALCSPELPPALHCPPLPQLVWHQLPSHATDLIKLESPRLVLRKQPSSHGRPRGPKLLRQQSCPQGQGTDDTATLATGGRFTDTGERRAPRQSRAPEEPPGNSDGVRVAPPGQIAPEHGAAIFHQDVPLTVSHCLQIVLPEPWAAELDHCQAPLQSQPRPWPGTWVRHQSFAKQAPGWPMAPRLSGRTPLGDSPQVTQCPSAHCSVRTARSAR